MEFNITEELAAFMRMKGTTTGADLCEYAKKVLQSLHIPIQKLSGLVMDGAPSMTGRNSGISSLITNDMKNTMDGQFDVLLLHTP
jgi:hypothetical protein